MTEYSLLDDTGTAWDFKLIVRLDHTDKLAYISGEDRTSFFVTLIKIIAHQYWLEFIHFKTDK